MYMDTWIFKKIKTFKLLSFCTRSILSPSASKDDTDIGSAAITLPKMEAGLKHVKAWMTNNFLLLNTDKTEAMIAGTKQLRAFGKHLIASH